MLTNVAIAAYRYLAPLVMLAAFATYCYSEIKQAGGGNAYMQGATAALSVGATAMIGRWGAAQAFGSVLSSCATALNMAGDSAYFGILGMAVVECAVYSIMLCTELMVDDYLQG
jgi:hypothetical protein